MSRTIGRVLGAGFSAATLTVALLSGALVGSASAATAQIAVTGQWVYPGALKFAVNGTPTAPMSQGHYTEWEVFALASTTPCPTTIDGLNQEFPYGSDVAYGQADRATFSYADTITYSTATRLLDLYKPNHLCGIIMETTSTGKTITAHVETPLPARVLDYGVSVLSGGTSPKIYANGWVYDVWTPTKYHVVPSDDFDGKMALSVTRKVKREVGLPSKILGTSTLHPYDSGGIYSFFSLSRATKTALAKWHEAGGYSFLMTLKVTVTSPISWTASDTYRYGKSKVSLWSWEQ